MTERIPDVSERTVQRADVAWSINEFGRVVITKRKFGRFGTRMLKLFRISPDLQLTLDPVGSCAWQVMDGRKVKEVLTALEAEFPGQDDLGPRLGKFLGTLVGSALVELG